jgi:hypothetical protein
VHHEMESCSVHWTCCGWKTRCCAAVVENLLYITMCRCQAQNRRQLQQAAVAGAASSERSPMSASTARQNSSAGAVSSQTCTEREREKRERERQPDASLPELTTLRESAESYSTSACATIAEKSCACSASCSARSLEKHVHPCTSPVHTCLRQTEAKHKLLLRCWLAKCSRTATATRRTQQMATSGSAEQMMPRELR